MVQLRSLDSPAQDSFAQCWVNVEQEEEARQIAASKFRERGWDLFDVEEIASTQLSDYFSPCLSQQAFLRAEQQGFACRITHEENNAGY